MDNSVLKKRLNTYKTSNGTLKSVGDDVVMEVLRVWENWPGKAKDLYPELGLSKMQMVTMIQKAKRLVKRGAITESEFREVKVVPSSPDELGNCGGAITMRWSKDRVIKFSQVDQLVDFLKKVS